MMKMNGSTWQNVGSPGFTAGEARNISLTFNPSGDPQVAFQDWGHDKKLSVMKYSLACLEDSSVYAVATPGTYAMTITSQAGCSVRSSNQVTVSVGTVPVPTITGPVNPCENAPGITYNTETGMSSYTWNVSSGGTITAGGTSTDHSATILWYLTGVQSVDVNYTNPSGCTGAAPAVLNVTVGPLPGPAGVITGADTLCAGSSNVTYSVDSISNALTYVWTLPSGTTIQSGNWTNSITVNFSTNAYSGVISVLGNNTCGNGVPSPNLYLTVNPLPATPGNIAGPDEICLPAYGIVYTVPAVPWATGYLWTLPPGALIVSGLNSDSITVDFPQGTIPGPMHVTASNDCGYSPSSPDLNILVNTTPPPPVITQNGESLNSSSVAGNQWV
jgi:hypothetical protein